MRIALLVIALLVGVARADAPPEIAIIVNADNQATISAGYLEDLFLKKERFWSGDVPVVVLAGTPDNPVRREFDRVVLGLDPEASARYWIDARIRSGEVAPKEISDPALAVKLVAKLKGGIAYVPASTALAGVRVIARIKKGKLSIGN